MHGVGSALPQGGIAPERNHAHVERFRELGKSPADRADPDHDHGLAPELILATRGIADHVAPHTFCLIITCLGDPARKCQDERHRVLRDCAVVDAARAGQADAARGKYSARKLVGAGTDRLDEPELFGTVEKAVMPQPGDHQHIGLVYPVLQGLGIADAKALDPGIEDRKPLMQLIGGVGEADRRHWRGERLQIEKEQTRRHEHGRDPRCPHGPATFVAVEAALADVFAPPSPR